MHINMNCVFIIIIKGESNSSELFSVAVFGISDDTNGGNQSEHPTRCYQSPQPPMIISFVCHCLVQSFSSQSIISEKKGKEEEKIHKSDVISGILESGGERCN